MNKVSTFAPASREKHATSRAQYRGLKIKQIIFPKHLVNKKISSTFAPALRVRHETKTSSESQYLSTIQLRFRNQK